MSRAVQASSWAELRRPPYALSAVVVVLGILAPAFSLFITATVLPSAIAEIGGLSIYAWASTAYGVRSILGSAAGSASFPKAGMRRGCLLPAAAFGVAPGVWPAAPR